MHLHHNQLLLLLFGALLVCETNSSFSGMATIYTSAAETQFSDTQSGNSANSGHTNHHMHKPCPSGPPPQWESQLDVASKAYLAPIVFYGKLISITEDYAGKIGATFRITKLIKNSTTSSTISTSSSTGNTLSPNLVLGSQVILHFVRNKSHRKLEPPQCAIYMNQQLVELRPQEKYILFASPPVTVQTSTVYNNVANSMTDSNHHIYRSNSHTVINLSAFASPVLHNKTSSRQVRKVLCTRCGKYRPNSYCIYHTINTVSQY
jgi:hypothetical protein